MEYRIQHRLTVPDAIERRISKRFKWQVAILVTTPKKEGDKIIQDLFKFIKTQ